MNEIINNDNVSPSPESTLKKWQKKFKRAEMGDKRPLKEIAKSDAKLVGSFIKKGAKKTGSATKKGLGFMKRKSIDGLKGIKGKIGNIKENKKPKKADITNQLLTEIRDALIAEKNVDIEPKE